MQSKSQITTSTWFQKLDEGQQALIETALILREEARSKSPDGHFSDYSYIIFPMAKAYEGFIKKFLLKLNLINARTYSSKRFRIGRAINPDVRKQHRDKSWVYDDLSQVCGVDTARVLWEAWLECRNRVFHYFPGKKITLSFAEVEKKLDLLLSSMEQASQCL